MKYLILLSLFLSSNSWSKTCFKSQRVQTGDSLYKIYSNFKYKSQSSYKVFVSEVKKENGMTKGSDILKMTNKFISIPYRCSNNLKVVSKKRTTLKNKLRPISKKTKNQTYDPLGLSANRYSLNKNKKRNLLKNNVDLTLESSSLNYKTKTIATNEFSPASLELSKKLKLNTQNTSLTNSLKIRSKIFSNGLKNNISTQDFEIGSLFTNKFKNVDISMGVFIADSKLLSDDLETVRSYKQTGFKFKVGWDFNINYYSFTANYERDQSLFHLNPDSTNLTRSSRNIISTSWHLAKSYSLTASYINESFVNTYENIDKDGLGVSLKLKL